MNGPILKSNEWQHLTGTFDGNRIKVYVNGIIRQSRDWAFPMNSNTNPFYIGGAIWGNMFGLIDDVRIYNRALTPEEVQALYGNPPGSGCIPQ